ncbi:uncharacterized protein LOC132144603 [Carassius carassius]|uniref:uncharacterized protein LOC132144603 n=1 Tax=Carassius carassius TaxID=217509 RepID=UPI002868833C|nr:uncharacterized protein LOC132144603 [Carassius carassius]
MILTMFSNLLLLFCFIYYSGTARAGTKLLHVTGKKGDSVILPCESEARQISHYHLSSWSKTTYVCQNEECESENGRVFKPGNCDVVIKDLNFSDAGKYVLRVDYNNAQSMLERLTLEYYLHIQDEISVKMGEELKLDVLLTNTEKVVHQNKISTEWTVVWKRRAGVMSDRLTVRDGNLNINALTVTDAGTYRVLDFDDEILITVTVTGSGTDSKENHTDDKTDDTKQVSVLGWMIPNGMGFSLVVLCLTLILILTRNHRIFRYMYFKFGYDYR